MAVSKNRDQGLAVPGIEVEFWPAHAPAFAAVVRLCGEHDIATSDGIVQTLAPIDGNILVDLSDCEFVDSSVITALVLDSRERAREGHRIELLVRPDKPVAHAIELTQVGAVIKVRTSIDDA